MTKLAKPRELIESLLGVELEYDVAVFEGINIRYCEESSHIQIGDIDFDRWANSVDLSFDLGQKKGQRQFKRWALRLQEDKAVADQWV